MPRRTRRIRIPIKYKIRTRIQWITITCPVCGGKHKIRPGQHNYCRGVRVA